MYIYAYICKYVHRQGTIVETITEMPYMYLYIHAYMNAIHVFSGVCHTCIFTYIHVYICHICIFRSMPYMYFHIYTCIYMPYMYFQEYQNGPIYYSTMLQIFLRMIHVYICGSMYVCMYVCMYVYCVLLDNECSTRA